MTRGKEIRKMTALMGTTVYILAICLALWMGYQLGIERGIEKERTKRGIRRWRSD
jgi:cytosine/uracil/thiamine/allantoin permease